MRSRDLEFLIEQVKVRPPLWNAKNPSHHDNIYKKKLWKQVAKSTNFTEDSVRSEWCSLKNVFKRELLHVLPQLEEGKPPDETASNWPFFKHMLFLKDEFKHLTRVAAAPRSASPEHTSFLVFGGELIKITETTHDAFVTEFQCESKKTEKASEPSKSRTSQDKDTTEKVVEKNLGRSREAPAKEAIPSVIDIVEILSDDSETETIPVEKPVGVTEPSPVVEMASPAKDTPTPTSNQHSRDVEECGPFSVEEVRQLVGKTDPLVGFFASVLPHLRNVPSGKKERLKQRIKQLVIDSADHTKLPRQQSVPDSS